MLYLLYYLLYVLDGNKEIASETFEIMLQNLMDYDKLITKLRTGSPPAPENLVLLEGFLNTCHGEMGFDDFETVDSMQAWLRSVDLWTGPSDITSAQSEIIIKFRSDLRTWILGKERFRTLNELVATIPFQAEFSSEGEVRLHSKGNVFDRVLGALIEVILESQQNGTWDRFKCCALSTCGWAFYDPTRSRTKRWCSMKTCGSRHKAREYYKRKR
jgi:predicted RNA-binding Zn ribbon-like protein